MSEPYIVSARKYRPATFASVVGQKNLTATLKGAISSGRLAHAYLFCGPRGVGKTSCARIFAKTINCLNPRPDGESCGECESCKAIDRGASFNLVELDAASNNKVEHMRELISQVNVPPQVGKYRVFIIDEVHMLTSQAFNAFLKTLEEPPAYCVFILATTEKHKVIPTILSRCQIYDFKRITINDTIDHLAYVAESEGIKADRRALGVIASKADGAMRDALSIFDQVANSSGGVITYESAIENLNVLDYDYFFKLVDSFAKGDAAESLLLYKEVRDRGFDSLFFVNSLAQHVRDLMVAADQRTLPMLETSAEIGEQLVKQAASLPLKWYYAAMKLLNDCDLAYRTSTNKQLLVELTLIRLSQLLNPATPPFDLSDRPVALRDPSEQPRATVSTRQILERPIADAAPAEQRTQRPRPRGGTFRLTQDADSSVGSLERKNAEFTDERLYQVWKEYADKNPDHQILASAIRNSLPKRVGANEFEVLVDNPAQQQAFESDMRKLLEFLRERLGNDFITIKASIDPNKEIPKMLPPGEFLKKAVSGNPALGEWLRGLDIEIVN